MTTKPGKQTVLLLPLVVVYGGLAVLPVVTIVQMSFQSGFSSFRKLLASPILLPVVENTIVISFTTTVTAVFLGYLLAAALWRSSGATRIAILAFILLPFWTGVLIKNFAWALLLQDNGPINNALLWIGLVDAPLKLLHNRFAVIVGTVHYTVPYAVLPIYSAMTAIDLRLERAARSMGASTAAVLWNVTLPLTRSGTYAAALLVLIISVGFYITPVVLGSPHDMMVANLVEFYTDQLVDFSTAAALAVLVLLAVIPLVVIYQRMPKEGQYGI